MYSALTFTQVAEWEPSGRAADMFSLGCVLLEILVLNREGTLDRIRTHRSTKNTAFYANLNRLDDWLPLQDTVSSMEYHLIKEVRAMLSSDSDRRPRAQDLLHRLNFCDQLDPAENNEHSIFGDCCRNSYVTEKKYKKELARCEEKHGELLRTIEQSKRREIDLKSQVEYLESQEDL